MKLLIVNSRFLPLIGGGETYILELMYYFSENGWEVHLLTNNNGYAQPTWNDCVVHSIDGFSDSDGHINQAAPQFRRVLDDVQPDLIHIHNIMPYFVYSSIAGPHEFPVVLTIHNTPHIPDRLFGNFEDFSAEIAFCEQLFTNERHQKLLFGSAYYLDAYAQAVPKILNDDTAVAHYFPPRLTVGPAMPRDANYTKVRVLFPSRIIARKGIEDCLQAFARLPDNFTLDLPAMSSSEIDGYNQKITKMITELNLTDRIIKPKRITMPDMMHAHYEQADIVVIPSHYEGFGIVAVEALSWGIPVITTGAGGLGEIIQDEFNGIYCAIGDPGSLAKGIRRVVDDVALRSKIVANGLSTVKEKFSYERHMKQITEVYNEVLRTDE